MRKCIIFFIWTLYYDLTIWNSLVPLKYYQNNPSKLSVFFQIEWWERLMADVSLKERQGTVTQVALDPAKQLFRLNKVFSKITWLYRPPTLLAWWLIWTLQLDVWHQKIMHRDAGILPGLSIAKQVNKLFLCVPSFCLSNFVQIYWFSFYILGNELWHKSDSYIKNEGTTHINIEE